MDQDEDEKKTKLNTRKRTRTRAMTKTRPGTIRKTKVGMKKRMKKKESSNYLLYKSVSSR